MARTVAVMGKGEVAAHAAGYFARSPDWDLVMLVPVTPELDWCPSLRTVAQDLARSGHGDVPIGAHHREVPQGLNLVLSCQYEKIIGNSFIALHDLVLNVHNAPVPKYRGVNPINWALKNGERQHGVTIHQIPDEGIDSGSIYGQVIFPITPENDEVRDVYGWCNEYGILLFNQVIKNIDHITPVPQDDTQAVYYSKNDKDGLGDRGSWTRAEA